MGWDWGWAMAFPLVSSHFWGVEYDRPSLNPYCFSEKIFCFLFVSFLEGQLENTETLERKRKREREQKLENMETRWVIELGAASESELLESKAKGSTEC